MTIAAIAVEHLPTVLGELVVVTDAAGALRLVDWADGGERIALLLARQPGLGDARPARPMRPTAAAAALIAYFTGDVEAVDRLPVARVGTPFQRQVWRALRAIPCGRTVTYGELARRVGRPGAARAAGLANGSNPVSIVVPCHRVVGADGALTGYGGGIERKRWLLAHEAAAVAASAPPTGQSAASTPQRLSRCSQPRSPWTSIRHQSPSQP